MSVLDIRRQRVVKAGAGISVTNSGNNATVALIGSASSARDVLSSNRTYYVRTDGNDSNDGLSNTSGGAKLTFAGAYLAICNSIDFGGYTVTIQMANTTWTDQCLLDKAWTGGGSLILDCAGGTISTTSADAIYITFPLPGVFTFQNMTLTTTTLGYSLHVTAPCVVMGGAGLVFGAAAEGHIFNTDGSITMSASYTITGSAAYSHVNPFGRGIFLAYSPIVITLVGTPSFDGFVFAQGALVECNCTITGSATGVRFYASSLGGCIQTYGKAIATYFPGDAAGVLAHGGMFR